MAERMPALFIGHGYPMNALLVNPYTQRWATIGATLAEAEGNTFGVGPLVHRRRSCHRGHRAEDDPRFRRLSARAKAVVPLPRTFYPQLLFPPRTLNNFQRHPCHEVVVITVNFSLKGWRRRFNSVPGHHISKDLSQTGDFPSVRSQSARFGEIRFDSWPVMIMKDLTPIASFLSPL